MKNKLNICFIASEVEPFAKTSSMADFARSLPKALKEIGHEVRVMMPNYKSVNERKYVLRDVIRLKDMKITLNDSEINVSAKSAFLPDSKVQIYFLDNKDYFGREGLYHDPKTGKAFADNDERFIAFCKGCLETLRMLHWQPDIIHCNDWQTGFIPLFIRAVLADDPFFQNTKLVFSIHNIAEQGIFPAETLAKAGIPKEHVLESHLNEGSDKVNLLKAAVASSNLVLFGSKRLAEDIAADASLAPGLDPVLADVHDKLQGLMSGTDYTDWNPEEDEYIAANYTSKSIGKKSENKKALLEKLGLPYEPSAPLISVLPAHDDSSIRLLKESIQELTALNAQIIITGAGETKFESEFKALEKKYPKHVRLQFGNDEELEHQLIAAEDMQVILSPGMNNGYDPLLSMKYGVVTIGYDSGIIADAVKDFAANEEQSTGFLFKEYTKQALIGALKKAIEVFHEEKRWHRLMRNSMKQDFSWRTTAANYAKAYMKILTSKNNH